MAQMILEKPIKFDYDEVSDEENDKIIQALEELSEEDLEIVKREIIYF